MKNTEGAECQCCDCFLGLLIASYLKIALLTLSLQSPLISSDKLNDVAEEAEYADDLYCPACDKLLKTEKA